jgi:hypothetical protein
MNLKQTQALVQWLKDHGEEVRLEIYDDGIVISKYIPEYDDYSGGKPGSSEETHNNLGRLVFGIVYEDARLTALEGGDNLEGLYDVVAAVVRDLCQNQFGLEFI